MPKSRRRVIVIALSALVLLAVVAGGMVLVFSLRTPPPSQPGLPAVKTTTVRKADLANTRAAPALLGFGKSRPVKGAGSGTVTRLPAVGAVSALGKPLYWVDDRPVPVFYGATPLFRKLDTTGTTGSDVAMLRDNLARLGYPMGRRPSDATKAEFTPTVAEALKKWQQKAGLEPTGTLDVGQLLVLDAPARVASVEAQVGSVASEQLFTLTGNERVVTMTLGIGESGELKAGTPVAVVRPDGRDVPAKVKSVTPAAPAGDGQAGGSGGGPGGGEQRMEIVINPDDPAGVADLDPMAVQVKITTDSRTDVLVVPVDALIALREGGYAVQLPGGQLRGVQTGMYARNDVEISGPGITEGLTVVTAS